MSASARTTRLMKHQITAPSTLTWNKGPHAILLLEKRGTLYSVPFATMEGPPTINVSLDTSGSLVPVVRRVGHEFVAEFSITDSIPLFVPVTARATGDVSCILFLFPEEKTPIVECPATPTIVDQRVLHA